ncbi:hypothetical protein G8759_14655 [Spirosoma aureum]|uniref:Transposase n=1 Tax=Spirosoma aureum TaxID=2692134 RepID=A0A6G9AN49_9BACT|nr:hypothetical protein G8759_14655 [Spirosoma aureum]
MLEGLQGEQSVAEICRREGLNTNIYYRWIGPISMIQTTNGE